jgi:hypothetical protein
MKPCNQILNAARITLACFLMMASPGIIRAQLPDCASGTVMYAIYNDSIGSSAASPSEIRSVNYATGAVGPLMGGTTFLIRRGAFYGSAALGVDILTNRFYVISQMNAASQKSIITINTVTNTQTLIGSTPTPLLDNHHLVKTAIAPSGFGYAIGVARDSTLPAATFNPLIRYTTCGGAPALNCSVISLMGYLPVLTSMTRFDLFNGDIAFDAAGNLYFATASYGVVAGSGATGRYKDARLFRINAIDIPALPGAGVIPMSLIADYNSLDSSVVNGIAFDPAGAMYIATRKWTGIQVSPYTNNLFKSTSPGTATELLGFGPKTIGYSIADLASCYFPLTILPNEIVDLTASNLAGKAQLKFKAHNNQDVLAYEILRADTDPNDFTVIGTLPISNPDRAEASYAFTDTETEPGKTYFYRIRSIMPDGKRLYSNIVKLSFGNNISLQIKPWPNPFSSQVVFNLETKAPQNITLRIIDEQGRVVKSANQVLQRGVNKVVLNDLSNLKKGLYILEVSGETDMVREKLMKL